MSILQERARSERKTLKHEVAQALSKGLGLTVQADPDLSLTAFNMGSAPVDYAKAWDMIEEMEQSAVAEKMDLKK